MGEAPSEFPASIEDYYQKIYFESVDTIVNCIQSRFQQKNYLNCYAKVESILLCAAKGESFEEHISSICDFYGDDLSTNNLKTQLSLLGTLFEGLNKTSIDITFIVKKLHKLTKAQKILFSELVILVKLLLLAPATNAVSERSYLTLKTYL